MANGSLAVSSHHRNSISEIVSTKLNYLDENYPEIDGSIPYSLPELGVLMSLAFTAIIAEDKNVEHCRSEFGIFLNNRNALLDPDKLGILSIVVSHIFENGLLAFKALGYPRYFDEFIWAYRSVLSTTNRVPIEIKHEMQNILQRMTNP